MRRANILTLFIYCAAVAKAQSPVQWSWKSEKVGEKEYEVKLTAMLQDGWHLYSQKQPDDAIAIPTEIIFNKNPMLELEDQVKENGKLEKYHDKTVEIEAWQYSNRVEFLQKIKMKDNCKNCDHWFG